MFYLLPVPVATAAGPVLGVALWLLPGLLGATHIAGVDLTYRCLGGNQYEITFTQYNDCINGQTGFDDEVLIWIFEANTGDTFRVLRLRDPVITPLQSSITDACFSGAPPPICIEEGVYTAVVTLPPRSQGYHIGWTRCCRNGIINNLSNPLDQGITQYVSVPDPGAANCNDSPVFRNRPPLFLCAGQTFTFDHSAFDANGDSLVYELRQPLGGLNAQGLGTRPQQGQSATSLVPGNINPMGPPPYSAIQYSPGYSLAQPFGVGNGSTVQIDPQNGLLFFEPGNQLGTYVLAIAVSEYRNGQLLGTVVRDIQFNVYACTPPTSQPQLVKQDAPNGQPLPSDTLQLYPGDSLCYFLRASDLVQGDSVTLELRNPPQGVSANFSGFSPRQGLVCYTSNCGLADTLIKIIAEARDPDNCIYYDGALDTTFIYLGDTTRPDTPNWRLNSPGCVTQGASVTFLTNNLPPDMQWVWRTDPADTSLNPGPLPNAKDTTVFSNDTLYLRSRVISTGCWYGPLLELPLQVVPVPPQPPPLQQNGPGCSDTGVTVWTAGSPPPNVQWFWQTQPTGIDTSTPDTAIRRTYSDTLYLRARSDTGACWGPATPGVSVRVNPVPDQLPLLDNSGARCADTGVILSLRANPQGPHQWYWQPDDTSRSTNRFARDTTLFASDTLYLRLLDPRTGCWATQAYPQPVTVYPLPTVQAVGDTACPGFSALLRAQTPDTNRVLWYRPGSNSPTSFLFELPTPPLFPGDSLRYGAVALSPQGCRSPDTAWAKAFSHPELDLSFALDPYLLTTEAPTLTLSLNQPELSTSWAWLLGNGDTLRDSSASGISTYAYSEPGSYTVRLQARDTNGCLRLAEADRPVRVEGEIALDIPNAFSPNNDANNDFWRLFPAGLDSVHILLFDRWGNLLLQGNDLNFRWNGSDADGRPLPEGVYTYLIRGRTREGDFLQREGTVTLIR